MAWYQLEKKIKRRNGTILSFFLELKFVVLSGNKSEETTQVALKNLLVRRQVQGLAEYRSPLEIEMSSSSIKASHKGWAKV